MSTLQTFRRHRKPLGGALAALMAVWQIGQPLQAADHTWTAGTSTDFNWDDASNWSGGVPTISGTGTAILPFLIPNPGSLPNPSVLTLGASSEAYLVDFKNNYTLSGGTLNLGAGGLDADQGVSATISGTVTVGGTAGLTKRGGGSVRLTNVLNNYTGTTSIRNGSLIINSEAALGGTGAVSITVENKTPLSTSVTGFAGGALVLDGTAGGFSFSRDINLEGAGPLGGRSAALVSLGNNTLSGTVTSAVTATATVFRNTRLNSAYGTLTLSGTLNAAGATVTAGTNAATTGTVTTLGGINSAGVGNFNLTGTITGGGILEKTGAGTLFLNPTNTSGFQGQVRVSASAVGQQSSVRVTQALAGTGSIFGASTKTGDASSIDLNGGVLEFRSDSNMNFDAFTGGKTVYQRASSPVFTGPAAGGAAVNGLTTLGNFHTDRSLTLTTRSRNGFGLTLGTLTLERTDGNSDIANEMGGTLTFTGNIWNNDATAARNLTFSGNGNTRIVGSINASGLNKQLIKQGTGVLTLNGTAATYTGATQIQGGSVQITDFRSLGIGAAGTAPINLGNGGTTGGNLIVGGLGVATGSAPALITSRPINFLVTSAQSSIYANQTGANPVVLNGTITSTATTGNINLGGSNTADNIITTALPLSGTGLGLTKVGAGTWVLSAANLYQGATNIQAGTLKLRASTGGTSNVIPETATNTIVFSEQATAQTAGGTLEFGTLAATGSATETLGSLIPTAGAATVRLQGLTGSAASLTFTSLGATTAASSVNFITSSGSGGIITLTGAASATATTLPGTTNFQGHLYHNGADFADVTAGVVGSPIYVTGTAGNFQNAGASLVAGFHNRLTVAAATGTGSTTISSLVTNSQTLTLGDNLVISTGALLQSGGTGSIVSNSGTSRLLTAGATATNVAIRVNNPTDVLNLGSAANPVNIGSTMTGGLTKNGAGRLNIFGTNAQTGTTTINEGTIALSGTSARLSATSAGLVVRQGATLSLGAGVTNANAVVSTVNGSGTITGTAGLTFTQNGGGTWNGVYAGTGFSVTKTGGAATWSGLSTYTGTTTIGGTGLVTVDTLAIGGTSSGIGASTNAAANLVLGGTTTAAGIDYRGNIIDNAITLGSRSASTDRLFTLVGTSGATLSSSVSNNNAIVWSNTGTIVNNTTANATLIFGGASTGDNTFVPQLTDSSVGGVILAVTKNGAGQWNLGASSNLYSGVTTINEGILGLNNNGALSGSSPLFLAPTSATSVAVLQMSGTFERNLASSAVAGTGSITFGGTTASTTGGVGFAAHSTPLLVAIGGTASPTALTWGAGGFIGTGTAQNLVLNSTSALSVVDIRNAINLGNTARTVNVLDNNNTGADYAIMSGVLSSTGTSGGLVKIGAGVLELSGANSYTGTTQLQGGTLVVSSLGSSTGGATSNVGAGAVTMDDTNAVVLGAGGAQATGLVYVGAGEVSDRKIRLNASGTNHVNAIYADGSGPLILSNVSNDMLAGAKTLSLRGSNMQGNAITSVLSQTGTAALTVTLDGAASWTLSGNNNYTGTTNANGGALGIGHNSALGTGMLSINNGSVFASGADRTIANNVTLVNATNGWLGDYGITITGTANLGEGTVTTVNNIVGAGKKLTFDGGVNTTNTANRAWTIDGLGETVVNGTFTTSGTSAWRFDVNGGGTLTLGTNGATSNFNQNLAQSAVDVDRGTLKFSANNAIPSGLATSSGVIMTPEVATSDTARIDLNGTTQTFTSFTATADGISIIDNSAAGPATLIVGAQNGAVAFGFGGTGTYSITESGGGAINLTKTGTGNANFTGSLGNTGTVTANGGVLNINSASVATGAVGNGGTVNFKGGFTTPANLATITTDNGGLVSLANGVGTPFSNLATLNLSLNGNSSLELDAGDSGTDTLTAITASVANLTTLFIKDVDLSDLTTYDLILSPGGGLGTGANYTLSLAGYTGSTLSVTSTAVQLNVGTLNLTDVYWAGATSPATTAWNTKDGGGNTNFSDDVAGTVLATALPGKGQKVIFQAENLTGGAPLATTLEQAFTISSLEFRPSTTPADTSRTVNIAPGSVSSNSLTIRGSDGINLQSGAAGTVTISAPLVAGANQTWTVGDAETELLVTSTSSGSAIITVSGTAGLNRGMTITGAGIPVGATIASIDSPTQITLSGTAATATSTAANLLAYQNLNVTGALSGSGNITKAGNGTVTINGSNAALLGTYTNSAGKTLVNQLSGLGGQVGIPGSGTDITVTGGTFLYNNATAGTFVNDITLNGGTLSAGGAAHTYSGGINVTADSTINMRDLATSTTFGTTARNITLSGVVSGSSAITVDSVTTVSSGNELTGTLTFSGTSNTWNGDLNFTRGSATFTTGSSPNLTTNNINFNNRGRISLNGNSGTTLTRSGTLNFGAGAIGEITVDSPTDTGSPYTVVQNGAMTLGAGGTGGHARIFLVDAATTMTISGTATLGGNSSISVGGTAGNALTISGVITDGPNSYSLAINNDFNGWGQTNRTVILTNANTYDGGTDLASGTLQLGNKDALGTGALTVSAGSTIQALTDLSGVNAAPNAVNLGATLTVSGTSSLEFTGDVANSVDGARTLTNSLTAPAVLTFSGSNFNLAPVSGTAASLTLTGNGSTTISAAIANGSGFANGLTITSSGTTTLSGLNTYGGTTTMNASGGVLLLQGSSGTGGTTLTTGTIRLDSATNGGLSTGDLVLTAGTLTAVSTARSVSNNTLLTAVTLTGDQSLTFTGNFTNNGGNRTLINNITAPASATLAGSVFLSESGTAGRTLTIAGTGNTLISNAIQDFNGVGLPGALTITSSGTTTLSGPNTYNGLTTMNQPTGVLLLQGSNTGTGGTTLTAGTIQLDSATNSGLASGTLTLTAGTLTAVSTGRSLNNNTLLTAVTLTGNQDLTFTGNFTNNGGNRTLTNNITGPASGILAGNVYLSEGGSGRTLTIGGSGNTSITGPITNSSTGAGSSGVLAKAGLGTLTLSSTGNSYTGGTVINLGTVKTGASNVIPNTGTVTVNATSTGGASLDLDGNSDTIAALTFGGTGALADSVNTVATGAGTLTLGGTLTVASTGNFTTAPVISGNLNLGTANRSIVVGNSTGSDVDLDIQATVTGTGFGFTKTGAGTLKLSNTNTYSGTTTLDSGSGVSNGVILATADDALGTGAVNSVFATGATTGQFQLSGGITLSNNFTTSGLGSDGSVNGLIRSVSGANIISGNISMTGGGGVTFFRADTGASLTVGGTVGSVGNQAGRIVTLVGGGDFVFNGNIVNAISGNGNAGVSSGNTGTTTLNGTNTYTNATSVLAGSTLIAGSTQAFGVGSPTTVSGTLRLAGNSNSLGSITGTGIVENANATPATLTFGVNSITTTTFSGVIQDGTGGGALAVTKAGTGTTIFSGGVNTYTGITTITAGTLSIGSDSDLGTIPVSPVANQLTINGGTLATSATLDLALNRGVTLNASGGSFAPATGTTLGVAGDITGAGGLTVNGVGTLEFKGSAANTYTGLTTVTAGTLTLNKTGGALAIANPVSGSKVTPNILVNGGTLIWNGDEQIGDNSFINVTSGTVDFNNRNETFFNLVNSGGSINYGTGEIVVEDPIWSGGSNTVSGNTTFGFLDISGGTNNVTGTSSGGAGQLTIGTAGTPGPLTFSGSNNSPTLNLISDDTTAGRLRFRAGSSIELQFTGTGTSSGLIASTGTGANAGEVDLNGSTRTFNIGDAVGSAVDMTISANIVGAGAGVTKTGLGTLSLSGANTYDGGTNLNAGVIQVNSAGALGSTGTISFGGGTLQYTAANTTDYSARFSTAAGQAISIDTNGQDVTFASNLTSSGGSLAKTGAGTLQLTGANTYDLGTTVGAGGALLINNTTGSATGSGNVTTPTLGGSGSIVSSATSASVTVQSLLNVGNAGDTGGQDLVINLTGGSSSINLAGAAINFDLWTDFTSGVSNPFPASDLLNLNAGTIDITGGTLNVSALANVGNTWAFNTAWQLFNWNAVSPTGTFSTLNLPDLTTWNALAEWDTSNLYTTGTIQVILVPEPSRAMLLLLGLLSLGFRRRRNRL